MQAIEDHREVNTIDGDDLSAPTHSRDSINDAPSSPENIVIEEGLILWRLTRSKGF